MDDDTNATLSCRGSTDTAAKFPAGSRGWCAETACRMEATAPKPGNVHPGRSFPDLDHADLVAAGRAIAPSIDRAPSRPLGATILDAVSASRAVTRSNANLGIVLAIAPLAAVDDGMSIRRGVADILRRTTAADARDAWQAIAIATPGGLGRAGRHDLAGPPPPDLVEAMRLAADRDGIARLWATDFRELFDEVAPRLDEEIRRHGIDEGIVRAFLGLLARRPDTLVARRHGDAVAREVSSAAGRLFDGGEDGWRDRVAAFDASLRLSPRKNPGTTADFIAAGLYILLREGRLRVDA